MSATSSSGFSTSAATTRERREAAARPPEGLTRRRACELLGVPRSTGYYEPKGAHGDWARGTS